MKTPGKVTIRQLTTDWEINDFIATMVARARRDAPRVAELIRPVARVVRPRLKLMHGQVEAAERVADPHSFSALVRVDCEAG